MSRQMFNEPGYLRDIYKQYCREILGWKEVFDANSADSDINVIYSYRTPWPLVKERGVCLDTYFYPSTVFPTEESARNWYDRHMERKPLESQAD